MTKNKNKLTIKDEGLGGTRKFPGNEVSSPPPGNSNTGTIRTTCSFCNGTGKRYCIHCRGSKYYGESSSTNSLCPKCNGLGYSLESCPKCRGTGKIIKTEFNH